MRARHRHFLTALFVAVSVALSPAPTQSTTQLGAAHFDVHNCPSGTAWDNLVNRCV